MVEGGIVKKSIQLAVSCSGQFSPSLLGGGGGGGLTLPFQLSLGLRLEEMLEVGGSYEAIFIRR